MKPVITFYISILLVIIMGSCKKSIENNGLVGKWKLVEIYNGYGNGGNFRWNTVSFENSHILSFTASGNYSKAKAANGITECSGTYLLMNDFTLEINSGCNTVTESMFISRLSPGTLILDRSGIEGVIRYKYSAWQ